MALVVGNSAGSIGVHLLGSVSGLFGYSLFGPQVLDRSNMSRGR